MFYFTKKSAVYTKRKRRGFQSFFFKYLIHLYCKFNRKDWVRIRAHLKKLCNSFNLKNCKYCNVSYKCTSKYFSLVIDYL